jgi:hypothetical protein
MTSPTQRSLKLLRERGLVVQAVERWIPWATKPEDKDKPPSERGPPGIKQDLYGWIDLLAFNPETGELLAVQTTSGSNVSARIAKIREWPHLAAWLKRHGAVVHGWAKRGERGKRKLWDCREVPVTISEQALESVVALIPKE